MTILTTIKWEKGIPIKTGRYLVQIYNGAIDIDYFENGFWEKYKLKEIIRYSKLSDIENDLNMGLFNKYKESMEEFSNVMSKASEAMRNFIKEKNKFNLEEND